MRGRLLSIGVLALVACGPAVAQVSCGPGRVGELVCQDADVKALVHRIGAAAGRLRCPPADRSELKMVERLWGRRQYACGAATDVRSCLVDAMRAEIDDFDGSNGCAIASHPVKFETPDPSYVLAHARLYDGSEIQVMGTLRLADCAPGATSLVGKVHENGNDAAALDIRFASLPADQRDFLCSKQPFSQWRGTLRLTDAHVPYLFATDVLGVPLPPSAH